jgi:hypothetical protein
MLNMPGEGAGGMMARSGTAFCGGHRDGCPGLIGGAIGLVADTTGRKPDGDETIPRRKPGKGEPHVADALRTAYEETVRESVPDEFLDLLGKLS